MTRSIFFVSAASILVCVGVCFAKPPAAATTELLDAIRQVESGGNDDAVGDGGKAIGAYQIWYGYWKDAYDFDKTLGGTYQDCRDPDYARRVVLAYFSRYAPKDATCEQLARMHNGGCGILKRKGTTAWNNTTKYWIKVQKEMNK